jgi:hypothetical protein
MAHTKLYAAVAAAALTLTAGATSGTAYSPEHPNTTAVANCNANVAKQLEQERILDHGGEISLQPARADQLQQVLRGPRPAITGPAPDGRPA